MEKDLQTIELVGYGHPDRFADYISEKIMEQYMLKDQDAKCGIEVMVTRDMIFLGGEVKSSKDIDINILVYNAINRVYGEKWWPNFKNVKIINNIKKQSPELTKIQDKKIVAGDQGIVFATFNRHRIYTICDLYELMENVVEKFKLSPDWKLLYDERQNELSVSVCGAKKIMFTKISKYIRGLLIKTTKVIVNPAGEWLIGGPLSDTGMTGRKLMVETFGAGMPHGGGAFCGKDFSKVDKSGILIAFDIAQRHFRKNKIDNVVVELNYKIGDEFPLIYINGELSDLKIQSLNQFVKKLNYTNISEAVLKGGLSAFFKSEISFYELY